MIKYPRVCATRGTGDRNGFHRPFVCPTSADEESAIPLTCQKEEASKTLSSRFCWECLSLRNRGNRELSPVVVSGFAPAAARAFKFSDASLSLRDAPLLHKKDLASRSVRREAWVRFLRKQGFVFFPQWICYPIN